MIETTKQAYEDQKQSLWEILKESVRNVLTALKEEFLLRAAAALAESVAFALGLNPALSASKLAQAGAYAAGAATLHITGFEQGAVFKEPTLLPPSMVAEGGYDEAFLPLSPSVFSRIGDGIVNALSVQPQPALAMAGASIDMHGLFDGAVFNVRSDQDAIAIARETYSLFKTRVRGIGRDV